MDRFIVSGTPPVGAIVVTALHAALHSHHMTGVKFRDKRCKEDPIASRSESDGDVVTGNVVTNIYIVRSQLHRKKPKRPN